MDVNTSEESRRGTLDHCLALIDGYEKEEMRTRTWNTIHQRTPEEIRRECDFYRRRAYRTFKFLYSGDDKDKKISEEENLQDLQDPINDR